MQRFDSKKGSYKKRIMKRIILLIFTITFFIGCTKNETDIVMQYGQTQCADQWGYGNSEAATKEKLGKYLDSMGISYTKLNFSKSDPGVVCLACTCTSGGLFTLETTDPFVEKLVQLGFKKQ